jgi:hypothetical protein
LQTFVGQEGKQQGKALKATEAMLKDSIALIGVQVVSMGDDLRSAIQSGDVNLQKTAKELIEMITDVRTSLEDKYAGISRELDVLGKADQSVNSKLK